MAVFEILAGITVLIFGLYLFLTWNYNYWAKRGVPCLPTTPGFGSIVGPMMMRISFAELHTQIYNAYADYKYCGYYTILRPTLFIRDPDVIKTILIKDFQSFHDNDFYLREDIDPIMGKNPFIITGDRWKLVRGQLTPAFTSGKVKTYFPNMVDVTKRLTDYISKNLVSDKNKDGLSAKDISARYTVDVVIASSLGINARSFESPKPEFREMARKMLEGDGFLDSLRFLLSFTLPKLAELLRLRFVTEEIGQFFRGVVRESLQYRKDNNLVRNDFMEFMIQLRAKCTEYDFNEEHMTAQLVTFFTDGSETSAGALSYVLYEIAHNPEVFQKLRNEIDDILDKDDDINYDAIQEMTYLDCIISESLRLHPPGVMLRKICTEPFMLPPPKGDGPGLKVEVGIPLIIPLYQLHHDPNYFPNPEVFDPDRFSAERKHEIPKNTYLPFGDGPRTCLGRRLAVTQVKAAVVTLVRNFDIKVNKRTIEPLEVDPTMFLLHPKGGIWLDFSRREL